MTNFTEIALTQLEDGAYKPITGSGLKPYVEHFNKLVGVAELRAREVAEAKGEPIPAQTVPLNVSEEGQRYGFRIIQHKLVLSGFWGEDHTRDADIADFGKQFPDVHASIIDVSTPKANGNFAGLKNYVRRDYIRGECVATWGAEPIVWVPRTY